MQSLQRSIGQYRWKNFVIDVLHSVNTYKLAEKYDISLGLAVFAKQNKEELALSVLEETKLNKINLRLVEVV